MKAAVLTRKLTAGSVYNTTTGKMEGGQPKTQNLKLLLSSYKEKDVDGTAVRPTDMRAQVEVEKTQFEPLIDDSVFVVGKYWTVKNVKKDGLGILYIMQLREP